MNIKKAALISYSEDIDMLKAQYELGQFDFYDVVYIFDGPFEYVINQFSSENSYVALSETSFGKMLLKSKKFKYFYKTYKDELEKRIYAYEMIEEDLIFLHDADEFLEYDKDLLDTFISDSTFGVASFGCQNLYLSGVTLGNKKIQSAGELPKKNFCFKKSIISAAEHIDYLWLVNVNQKKTGNTLIFSPPVAIGYHFTQMRTQKGQISKINFYTSLYFKSHGVDKFSQEVVDNLNLKISNKNLSLLDAMDIYMRSNMSYSLTHNNDGNQFTLERMALSTYLEDCLIHIDANKYVFNSGEHLFYNGLSSWFFLYQPVDRLRIVSPIKASIDVKIYEYSIGHSPVLTLNESFDSTLKYKFINENRCLLGFLVCMTPRFKSESQIEKINILF